MLLRVQSIYHLQVPTFLAFGSALRQRGTQFGGLGGSDLSGPTGKCHL